MSEKILGEIRYDGDVEEFLRRVGSVMDTIMCDALAADLARMKRDGVSLMDRWAFRQTRWDTWPADRAKALGDMRANLMAEPVAAGEIFEFVRE